MIKKTVFVLPHHLDLTLFPFGPKMHCRDKEYYNGQQGKEYQDMKRTKSGCTKKKQSLIYKAKQIQNVNRKHISANQHVTLLKA